MQKMRLPNGRYVHQINPGETSLMYRNIVSGRSYLRHGVVLRRGATVFDVGANIGIATLFFHWDCPDVRIFAFEPAPQLYEALEANVAEHRVNAVLSRCALSCSPGVRGLTYYPDTTAMTSMYADPEDDARLTRVFLENSGFGPEDVADLAADRHRSEVAECELSTVSEVMHTSDITVIDLLKINVEKSEYDVLLGIDDEHWPSIHQLSVQLHDIEGRLDCIRDDLTARGYQVRVDQDPLLAGTEIFELFAVRI